jgi:hypothetical protein
MIRDKEVRASKARDLIVKGISIEDACMEVNISRTALYSVFSRESIAEIKTPYKRIIAKSKPVKSTVWLSNNYNGFY